MSNVAIVFGVMKRSWRRSALPERTLLWNEYPKDADLVNGETRISRSPAKSAMLAKAEANSEH